jgi:hypothetical protein
MAAEAEDIEIPSITLPDQVFDVQFHPHNDIVATALITGQLNLYVFKHFVMSNCVGSHRTSTVLQVLLFSRGSPICDGNAVS